MASTASNDLPHVNTISVPHSVTHWMLLLTCVYRYKSAFGPILRGMAFISVRIQRNSPHTVVMMILTMLMSHQESEWGRWWLKAQHANRWKKCIVIAKSQHCLVRRTTYHRPTELQQQKDIIRWGDKCFGFFYVT